MLMESSWKSSTMGNYRKKFDIEAISKFDLQRVSNKISIKKLLKEMKNKNVLDNPSRMTSKTVRTFYARVKEGHVELCFGL